MLKPAGFWTARLLLKPVSCLVRTVCAGPVSGPPVWIAGPRWTLGSFQCVDGDDQSGDFCRGDDDIWY
ncbi:hypothetical protein NC651_025748 [Populus alba x Populus x berolinensis]|nr:hypothetical protein NC651_025748 [Populus alba x Populus x berolinensis]